MSSKKSRQCETSAAEPKESSIVVGIGSSAGGLEVLRAVLANLRTDLPASLVVVQHMSPSSKSMLRELLARETGIPVVQAEDGAALWENHIYVTPPNADIVVENRRIRLQKLEERAGPKPSIDHFLTSLSQEFGESSVACILSGTGSDGTQGCRAVKSAGGITIAQAPETAKYDGMPRAAISAGVVEMVLSPTEIAREINNISVESRGPALFDDQGDEATKKVLQLLHQRTKVNFALYKPNTINRRLRRRMNAVKADTIEDYYEYVKAHPSEIAKLYQDVLISVTSFFRDNEQFSALRTHLKAYIGRNQHKESIRIWSAGCATGEEPYSLAIAALEAANELGQDLKIQVFATDINEQAMSTARTGYFPAASVQDLPIALRQRYFIQDDGGYRIRKEVRDLVLFARHDLTADPPFLKMDLISCRNLFIYFEQSVQDRVLRIFHYALNSNGLLFLGKSESIGQEKSFFRTLDANAKLFERTNRLPAASLSFAKLKPPSSGIALSSFQSGRKSQPQLERDLIRDFCPDSLVVTEDFRLSAVYGKAREYLRFPDGPMDQKLDALLHPSLKAQLMTLIHRCRRSNQIVRSGTILFDEGDQKIYLHAAIYPTHAFEEPKFVLGFYADEQEEVERKDVRSHSSREMEELERELMATREHLQSVIEEQETSNEELQALNEELQSANEELQSANEELETSNEELQSSNEELTTLNEELNIKTHELADLSGHLNAVQNAIVNPVLVVDSNLNLVNFNAKAAETLELRQDCLNRSFRLIASPVSLEPVFQIIENCLRHGQREEVRFQSGEKDFDAFCLPITSEITAKTTGVVATLIDNTTLMDSLRRADLAKKSMFRLMEGIPAKVSVRDSKGAYTYVNPTFCRSVGLREQDILGRTDLEIFGAVEGEKRQKRDTEALRTGQVLYADEVHSLNGDARVFHTARVPLWDDNGRITSICAVGVDISDRALAEERLRELQSVLSRAEDGFAVLQRRKGRFFISFASQQLFALCGLREDTLSATSIDEVIACLDPGMNADSVSHIVSQITGGKKASLQISGDHPQGRRYFDLKAFRIDERQLFLNIFDITESKTQELRLKRQEEDIERSGKLAALGQMAAGIAHELKTPLSTIQGYVDLIRELHAHADAEDAVQEAIDKIELTTTKMADIIVGLKSIARSDHNESFINCSLNQLIDDTLKICVFRLRNKGIRLQVNKLEKDLLIRAQPTQLSQVLINLINNSVDAVQEMSEKWIRLEAIEDEHDAVVRVIDSGKGIAEKVLSHVMTPFFTTKRDGTGLGLSLSQSIVKAHNGSLEMDRDCPNTCFQVRIPKTQVGLLKDPTSLEQTH